MDFKFPDPGKLSPPVLQCNDISFGYPGAVMAVMVGQPLPSQSLFLPVRFLTVVYSKVMFGIPRALCFIAVEDLLLYIRQTVAGKGSDVLLSILVTIL